MTTLSNHPTLLRWSCNGLAWICVALGVAGVVLPVLPTTPFLLVAAWAAARGSERLHRALYDHRRYGPLLRDWHQRGSVPRQAKWGAVVMLTISWVILTWRIDSAITAVASGIFFTALAIFLLTRPDSGALKNTVESLE